MSDQKKYENPYRFIPDNEGVVLDPKVNLGGTSLTGHLYMDYEKLCQVLGPPNHWNDYSNTWHKTDVEWHGTINGDVFSVYNWKNGPAYLGADGTPVRWIKEWHVGAKSYNTYLGLDNYISKQLEGENHE